MGKIAFLFSGQGSQYPGMGKSLFDISAAAREVFNAADELRPGTSDMCFYGTQEELNVTENTQPSVYCVDLAAAKALEEAGIRADFAAGFSLGEVAALSFAGAFSGTDGFLFVKERAGAMQAATLKNPGGMAAVLKLSNEKVAELCSKFENVWPVNFNCPGQVSAAGEKENLTGLCAAVAEAGGRAIPLAVSGAFHSPFMQGAAQELAPVLEKIEMKAPRIPVYANLNARPYEDNLKETLLSQVKSPVLWQQTLENLCSAGADTFIECGPGKILSGLVKKTLKNVKVLRVEDEKTLSETLSALNG